MKPKKVSRLMKMKIETEVDERKSEGSLKLVKRIVLSVKRQSEMR